MALTDKQRRFVEEYLVDLNATQAAIRAGYSKKTAASIGEENLRKPDIAKAIQEAQAARSKRTGITQDHVLRELAKIGFADIRKAVRWGGTKIQAGVDEDGEPTTEVYHGLVLVASNDIDDDTAAAIAEVSEGREGLKVKFHDKRGALVDIGRHLGMFKDKVEHSGPNGGPIPTTSLSTAEFEEVARKLLTEV
ncbi:terminase small subunit [Bordetella petrii]|uniref:Terminase small subunit n=1 Tax=Bordetella petrii (strain ATCC BAA-461 / DSM 12804 / CCUG 43448 / CIP 107267 / Se-1111R) TaxID=340100 RepID=A9I8Y9_BORPD|nr:terminase small subunit [Bordetella petrii]CAP41307.1 unnamed protein product [Bordetella petrii]